MTTTALRPGTRWRASHNPTGVVHVIRETRDGTALTHCGRVVTTTEGYPVRHHGGSNCPTCASATTQVTGAPRKPRPRGGSISI